MFSITKGVSLGFVFCFSSFLLSVLTLLFDFQTGLIFPLPASPQALGTFVGGSFDRRQCPSERDGLGWRTRSRRDRGCAHGNGTQGSGQLCMPPPKSSERESFNRLKAFIPEEMCPAAREFCLFLFSSAFCVSQF